MLPESTTPGGDAPDEEDVLPEAKDAVETEETDTEEPEGEEADEPEGEAEEDGEPKKLSKTAKKNARIRQKIETLEEIARHESNEADRLRAENARLRGDIGPAPKESEYADERSYTAALNAYEADKRVTARTQQNTEAAARDAQQRATVSKQNLFRERALALVDRYPDIEARVFNDATVPITTTMAEVIQDSERGPEVAYFLASNREEAGRISRMQPFAQAKEIGRIEATLDAPKPRTQSKAPPPPAILKGGKTLAAKDPDKMSMDEWLTWRNAQLKKRA